jgi:hypothetical protein
MQHFTSTAASVRKVLLPSSSHITFTEVHKIRNWYQTVIKLRQKISSVEFQYVLHMVFNVLVTQ